MSSNKILGVLLAGGKSRRMGGGDKCLLPLGEQTILQHVINRAAPQVDNLILNINGDTSRFKVYDLTIVTDSISGSAGPLAGVLAGLDWASEHNKDYDWVVTFPTDTPFFPNDLVGRLFDSVRNGEGELACAASGSRHHPVFGIWPVRLRDSLRTALVDEEIRKIDHWTSQYNLKKISFMYEKVDPFFNINRPEDLEFAEKLL